jgi:GT2 family glycosyltransferase
VNATRAPLFSIVTPVYEPPLTVLREMIESIRAQSFRDWQLVLVDDVSPSHEVRMILREAAASDARITVIERMINGRIVAASNDGVNAAIGEFIVLVDHDDLLTLDALAKMARAIEAEPLVDYLYSNEDKVDGAGVHYDLFEKPEWSPERLRGQMYTGHLSVLRADLVREVGAFHEGFDGSQDHDLVLRVTEKARRIVHVPEVLYHWRVVPGSAAGDVNAKPYAWEAGRRAVGEHLRRVGIEGAAEFGPLPGYYRVVRAAEPDVLASIIIPTRGSAGLVWGERRIFVLDAVASVMAKAGHTRFEVVVVYDSATPAEVLDKLRVLAGDHLVLTEFNEPFNFSAKCNAGFLVSSGDVIVLLNDDVEAISQDFLAQLIAPLSEPDVGMTGARLLYSDGTIQHAGHVYAKDHYVHAYIGQSDDDYGDFGALLVSREASGLTAACVAMRRSVFDSVGGLCEELPGSFNDVDLSFKIRSLGFRLVWLADVRLYHFESKTRDSRVHPWEHHLVVGRWPTPDKDLYLPMIPAIA